MFSFWTWFWILIFLVGIGQLLNVVVEGAKTIAKDERAQETFWTVVWKSLGGK